MNAAEPAALRAVHAEQLRELLARYDAGDADGFDSGLDVWVRAREDGLFANVARLTRRLHDTVTEFRLDERLTRLAGDEMPDARHRLDYVMQVTEKAAHRTLDLVDHARTVVNALSGSAAEIAQVREQVAAGKRRAPAATLDTVAGALGTHIAELRSTLSELSQAQEYQDISGQIIKRVLNLVRDVETALLELLRAACGGLQSGAVRPIQSAVKTDEPVLAGPTVPGLNVSASQQDADELLADLGF